MSNVSVQARPTGPEIIRVAADRMGESPDAPVLLTSAYRTVESVVREVASPAEVSVLAEEVWDLIGVYLDRAGWPYFRTYGGMAAELRFIADHYERELAAAAR